ncbi:MAG: hypothetical protein FD130_280 [Halothiobacillaceae bacterium]|nr:MAG: hypothetical protein FD130_280 [Halothiobacillaceae bacterium]
MHIRVLVIILMMLLVGCSSIPHEPTATPAPGIGTAKPLEPIPTTPPKPIVKEAPHEGRVLTVLRNQYEEWRSVKYRPGGMSKRGADCSGLVYMIYLNGFGVKLPRSSIEQASLGRAVPQHQLKPGDLVFFKTNPKEKHVGIYIGNRRFIHSSSKVGVTDSSMDSRYWSKRYWKASRIL